MGSALTPSATLIDFSQTPLADNYNHFYAKILDDVFSPSECAALIDLASSDDAWKPAGLSAESAEQQTVHSDFRNSERIIRVDNDTASMIYGRLRPLVEEDISIIEPGGKWEAITGKLKRKKGQVWALAGVCPRLSFLRYGPGHYFKPHCDGLNDYPDGSQKSFVTLHLYLNDSSVQSEELSGGATRFWTPNKKHFLDVEPKVGRVLVFQQRMLVHSGEEVIKGIKYTMRSDFMFEQVLAQ